MNPFADKPNEALSSLGETLLIERIRRWLGDSSPAAPFGIGDDCAVLPASGKPQLITVDPVIYGRHFDDAVSARLAGAKLFKRNLSDIAAMGGRPRAAVVALAIDPHVRISWLRGFYQGLAEVSRRYATPLVGGDVAHLEGGIVATLTLVGEAAGDRVLTRAGAGLGDWICVTGRLGGSLSSRHHCIFSPRLAEGQWLASCAELRSMMDLSDGLAKDLHALTPHHAVAALWEKHIPKRKGATLRAALCEGEDYELVFSVSSRADLDALRRAFLKRFPRTGFTCIGRFVAPGERGAGIIDLAAYHGFEHLRQ